MKERNSKILSTKDFDIPAGLERPLGSIDDLSKSIDMHDLKHPLLLGRMENRLVLLSGYRRLHACLSLGWTKIPCLIVDTIEEVSRIMEGERVDPLSYQERTVTEKIRHAQVLEYFHAPTAWQRRLMGASKGGSATKNEYLSPEERRKRRTGLTRELISRAVDMSSTTYQRAAHVLKQSLNDQLPSDQRKLAQEAMAEIDNGGSVSANYLKVKGLRGPDLGPPQEAVVGGSADQRRIFNNAMNTLAGVSQGLLQVHELHPRLPNDDIQTWIRSLSQARRSLEVVIKRLRSAQESRK